MNSIKSGLEGKMTKKMSLNDLKPHRKTAQKAKPYAMVHKEFLTLLNQQKFSEGLALLNANLNNHPNNTALLNNIALCYLRLGQYQQAYEYYSKSLKINSGLKADTNLYDGLAEVCYYLDKPEETIRFGQLALQTKLNLITPLAPLPFANQSPPKFNKNNKLENIISFSLFGDDPRYCETAILNVYWADVLYPEWTCRFYVDDSVPQHVIDRLKDKGAQVILVSDDIKASMSGLFWRFLVIDDPTVKRFLIRDADSLLSFRERSAVVRWCRSNKWFHTMRDYFSHTELILAGMWGGCHGPIDNIEKMITHYLAKNNNTSPRFQDQHFLRYEVYPILSQSVLAHDSQGFQQGADPMPNPEAKTPHEHHKRFHIGRNLGTSQVNFQLNPKSHTHVRWTLLNKKGQAICRYEQPLNGRTKMGVSLPDPYIEKIQSKEFKIHIECFTA